jgi:hypothetical protein
MCGGERSLSSALRKRPWLLEQRTVRKPPEHLLCALRPCRTVYERNPCGWPAIPGPEGITRLFVSAQECSRTAMCAIGDPAGCIRYRDWLVSMVDNLRCLRCSVRVLYLANFSCEALLGNVPPDLFRYKYLSSWAAGDTLNQTSWLWNPFLEKISSLS